jgi:hypothetical protein
LTGLIAFLKLFLITKLFVDKLNFYLTQAFL